MGSILDRVCPRPEFLATLPTLRVSTPREGDFQPFARFFPEIDFRLELKLERGEFRYWLCTQGADKGPEMFLVGYVTREPIGDSVAEEYLSYNIEDAWLYAGFTYLNALRDEMETLMTRQEQSFSHERGNEIDLIRREMVSVSQGMDYKESQSLAPEDEAD
jgi:hypothetical protein